MMEPVKVVAHYIDDIVVKGYAYDFNPTNSSFHLFKDIHLSSKNTILLEMKEIKALFFVKTFEGNIDYRERKEFLDNDRVLGRKAEITFIDGEVMRGFTVDYDPKRTGFFLIPIDPDSNNIQIFIVANAVLNIRFL